MSTLRSRVVVAGEPTVGKTQVIHQYLRNTFNHNYMMTQGCEYQVKEIASDNRSYSSVELHLIDIAGQNIFKEITFDLLCKANQVVLVYDVTNPDSFHLLRQWYEGIKQQNQGKQLQGVVIANKIDLDQRAAVSAQDGKAFANSIGFEFYETSALQGKGVEEPFKALARMFQDKFEERITSLQ